MTVRGLFENLDELAFSFLTSQEEEKALAKEFVKFFGIWILVRFCVSGVECSELNFWLKFMSRPQVYIVVFVNFEAIWMLKNSKILGVG